MKIKMIVTDLDRTLLRTDMSISDYTEGVLNRCRKSGIIVVYTNRHAPDDDRIAWDFTNEVPIAIHRISIRHNDPKQVMRIAEKYSDLRVYSNSGETLFDIGPEKADKSKGVYELSKLFGIPMSEIAAFGDDFNDIDMLKDCGVGVAVANACDEVKSAADDVCDSNDEDGVARWLEKNVIFD